jgi:adenylosuccinate lyase
MRSNLEQTRGLIFSGQLLLDLAAAGMLREDAYTLIQRHAIESWENDGDFIAAVEADPRIREYLTQEKLNQVFSLGRHLEHVDRIFERVFGS